MKVFHFPFTPTATAARPLAGQVAAGDVVIVALDRPVRDQVKQIIRKQFGTKTDATADLLALTDRFKESAPFPEYVAYVDKVVGRMEVFLYEGMTLQMQGNDFLHYLSAMVTELAARAVGANIPGSQVFDGRSLILSSRDGIEREASEERLKSLPADAVSVIAGGFGLGQAGETMTLRRTGSEVMAGMVAAVRDAEELVFLVEGYAPEAKATLTYEEAAQRFAAGRPVFPPVLYPASRTGIPVVLEGMDGTRLLTIQGQVEDVRRDGIAGVICSEDMELYTVFGTGLLGTIGVASSIFGSLAEAGVNIQFISQALSEYSITFAVSGHQTEKAEKALKKVIAASTSPDLYFDRSDVAVLSVYGSQMQNRPGVSGKVFSALGAAGVNILASSQGGEQLSISIVVAASDAAAAKAALERLV